MTDPGAERTSGGTPDTRSSGASGEQSDGPLRARPLARRTGILGALTAAALALAPGCATSNGIARHMEVTRLAYGAGMVVGGVPSIVAALPITLPLSCAFGGGAHGGDALGLMTLPALVPGGITGMAFAAPVALFELPVAFFRTWADWTARREPAAPVLVASR
jgi:hypothetical protein